LGLKPWNLGVHWSEEAKQKMSEAHIGHESPMKGIPRSEELKKLLSEIAIANFNPEHQQVMTEAARIANTGKPRTKEAKRNISEGNLRSEKRKAYAESRRGVARSKELGEKVSASLQTSEKAKAYHEGRVGKSRGNNPSGHYGVIWDKSRGKYQVRIRGKSYGRYERLEDAIAKAKEVMAELGME
jgi:hypothetical protein